jgi:hypothetical protein
MCERQFKSPITNLTFVAVMSWEFGNLRCCLPHAHQRIISCVCEKQSAFLILSL